MRRQKYRPTGAYRRLKEGDLVLTSEIPEWAGRGWPIARITRELPGEDEDTRLYELEMVPEAELGKDPEVHGTGKRLVLNKKRFIRNNRKIGLLPLAEEY